MSADANTPLSSPDVLFFNKALSLYGISVDLIISDRWSVGLELRLQSDSCFLESVLLAAISGFVFQMEREREREAEWSICQIGSVKSDAADYHVLIFMTSHGRNFCVNIRVEEDCCRQ